VASAAGVDADLVTLAGSTRAGRAAEGDLMPDVSFSELPGRRVVLRRFRPEDVAEFVAYRSLAEVARYQSWDAPYPPDEGERFVAQMMTAHPKRHFLSRWHLPANAQRSSATWNCSAWSR
jgi:RimJ/RimL family protein N-acetyltransferase